LSIEVFEHFTRPSLSATEKVAIHLRSFERCHDWLNRGSRVNAGAKMHRLAGAKIHQRFGKKAPELGAFSSGIKPAWDYPPRYRSWQGVSVACFD